MQFSYVNQTSSVQKDIATFFDCVSVCPRLGLSDFSRNLSFSKKEKKIKKQILPLKNQVYTVMLKRLMFLSSSSRIVCIIWLYIYCCSIDMAFTGEEGCANDTAIIFNLFNESAYSKHKLPDSNGVEVVVDLWIQEITSVSEISSDFEIDIYINELWADPMLKFEDLKPCKQTIALTHQMFEKIWTPNSCFINSKSASIHDSPFRNIFLMIYSNGTLWANYRWVKTHVWDYFPITDP